MSKDGLECRGQNLSNNCNFIPITPQFMTPYFYPPLPTYHSHPPILPSSPYPFHSENY
ncbi:hypothetical protein SK128_022123, partial [Halocaridina rubra]